MRLASFYIGSDLCYGPVVGGRVVAASGELRRRYPTVRDLLAADATRELESRAAHDGGVGIDEVELALPITDPSKILCVGRNYAAYHELRERGKPAWPSIFARFVSSFAAHGQAIVKPADSEQLDYEAELCIVIGRRARRVPSAHAVDYVAGYTIMNEGSVRDWQKHGSQNCPGKNFPRSGSVGPWLVTADEIDDPMSLEITASVDGERRQHGNTAAMLFSIGEAIAYISTFTQLEPGDLIATGSPSGSAIDHAPPRWLRPGQRLEITIEGLGTLRNPIVAE